jgi:hypothetical protein
MTVLELVTTDDLVAELARRYPNGVFCGAAPWKTGPLMNHRRQYWGEQAICVTMATMMVGKITHNIEEDAEDAESL